MKEIPFYKAQIDKKEEDLIKSALYNSDIRYSEIFEEDICKYFGVKHAVSTTSGTTALHLALCAMDIKRGDKILCSVNSFPNVAEVIRHFDAEPVFVDIDPISFNITSESLARTIDQNRHKKLKCAFISHIAGLAADIDAISEVAKSENIILIDDACRAMGATYKGAKIGALKSSLISCFQINPQAQDAISTAGFFVTNDDEIANAAQILRNGGIVGDAFYKDGNMSFTYDVDRIGQKYDLNAINSAYAIAQFEKTDTFIKRRKQIAAAYREQLANCPHVTLPSDSEEHIYTQFIVKIDKNRDDFAKALIARGVSVSLHYVPVHLLSYYKSKYNYKVNDFPNALKNYQQILSLPIYTALSDDDVSYICEQIKEIANNRV